MSSTEKAYKRFQTWDPYSTKTLAFTETTKNRRSCKPTECLKLTVQWRIDHCALFSSLSLQETALAVHQIGFMTSQLYKSRMHIIWQSHRVKYQVPLPQNCHNNWWESLHLLAFLIIFNNIFYNIKFAHPLDV